MNLLVCDGHMWPLKGTGIPKASESEMRALIILNAEISCKPDQNRLKNTKNTDICTVDN